MRFNILSYLFFIIIITFQNTQIVSATNGIKYLPTTNPDITYYKFSGCNKESNNNYISHEN